MVDGYTVRYTLAVAHKGVGLALSQTLYSRLSLPINPLFGVYTIVPSGFTVIDPFTGFVVIVTLAGFNEHPILAHLSFDKIFTVTGVFILVVAISGLATGGLVVEV